MASCRQKIAGELSHSHFDLIFVFLVYKIVLFKFPDLELDIVNKFIYCEEEEVKDTRYLNPILEDRQIDGDSVTVD